MLWLVPVAILLLWILWRMQPSKNTKPVTTMIVLGTGGHTTEMLLLIKQLDLRFFHPLVFVYTDDFCKQTAKPQYQKSVLSLPFPKYIFCPQYCLSLFWRFRELALLVKVGLLLYLPHFGQSQFQLNMFLLIT